MNFFSVLFAAILADNYILSKFMGICPFLGVSKKISSAVGMIPAVTFVMVMATATTYPIYHYLLFPNYTYLQTIVFILIIAALVQLVEMIVKRYSHSLYKALGIYLPLITTNCAVLGVSIINAEQMETFGLAITNALGAGIGFSLAILLFAGVRDRMSKNEIPKPFQGMPIALISASVMAVVFSGFKGLGG